MNIEAITPLLREFVLTRDQSRCRYCGCEDGPFHLDHVVPKSRGGLNTAENLVVACAKCNLWKKDRTPQEMGWTLRPIDARGRAFLHVHPQPRSGKKPAIWRRYIRKHEEKDFAELEREIAEAEAELKAINKEVATIRTRCIRRMRRDRGQE